MHREAVRVELREIEDVADEPLEPLRLGLDRLERLLPRAPGSSTTPLEQRRRRARGSRSAVCAARARPTSGSCAPSPRPRRAGAPSRRSARSSGRARPARSAAPRRRSCRPRPRRRRRRAAAPAARCGATGTTRAAPATSRPSTPAIASRSISERTLLAARRSSASRRRSRRSCVLRARRTIGLATAR